MTKPILCLDFDGVIHSYTTGWKGADVIPDPPVSGAFEFMRFALEHFEVYIYSSRSDQPGGIAAMQKWLDMETMKYYGYYNGPPAWVKSIKWPTAKPAARVTLDDRAITFTGTWPSFKELLEFKPWNKK